MSNMKKSGVVLVSLIISLLHLQACSIKKVPTKHIVMFNKKGNLVDPTGNFMGKHAVGLQYPEIDVPDEYFGNIMTGLKKHAETKPRKILFFFHGGLNNQKGTVQRAADRYKEIIDQGEYFPIFVNWQSSLFSSYTNHLFNIRQGRDLGWKTSWLAPLYLGADLVRGAVRFPVVALTQIQNDIRTIPFFKPYQSEMCVAKQLALAYRNDPEVTQKTIAVSVGENKVEWGDKVISGLTYTASLPVKWVLAPLLLDSFGTSSWDIMRRNTHLLFEREQDYFTGSPATEKSGGLYRFMKRLWETLRADTRDWEITLVGHSMGAIVMNELIRNFNDIHFENIVYMAGADTLRAYEETIFPYLSRHKNTTVYHLTLHPISEIRDRWGNTGWWSLFIDWPMRGSLLVWIDNFLAKPETPLDRTMGRFTNFMAAIHNTPDNLKNRLQVKAFGTGQDSEQVPQKHGDFGNHPFWDPKFWETSSPERTLENLEDYQCWNVAEPTEVTHG